MDAYQKTLLINFLSSEEERINNSLKEIETTETERTIEALSSTENRYISLAAQLVELRFFIYFLKEIKVLSSEAEDKCL